MSDFCFSVTDDQRDAIRRAAEVANLPTDEFARRALAALMAKYDVEFPDPPVRVVRRPSLPPLRKSAGGRPRKPPTWDMTRHVPAGDWARVCLWCGREFRTDNPRPDQGIFCSNECEVALQNSRAYRKRKAKQ